MAVESSFMTVGEVADRFGCRTWQVRRLYERGMLKPAKRVGPFRVVLPQELPEVEKALRLAGYLEEGSESICS